MTRYGSVLPARLSVCDSLSACHKQVLQLTSVLIALVTGWEVIQAGTELSW